MLRYLPGIVSVFILGCAGSTRTPGTYDVSMAVCSQELIDVVVRYETTPLDTILTVSISGSAMTAGRRDSLLRTCGGVVAADYSDPTTSIVSVGSRSIPCIARQRWILAIEERPEPPPLPR